RGGLLCLICRVSTRVDWQLQGRVLSTPRHVPVIQISRLCEHAFIPTVEDPAACLQ
ncbi:unnamed protein product, partial [Prorocentrum cordatum]